MAENGVFAVMFHVKNGFFHLYYSCGKLMKVVRLPPGYGRMLDCTFSGNDLYLTDHGGKKIYKYSTNGKFLKVIATGEHFLFITSCHNRLYVTTETRRLISKPKKFLQKNLKSVGMTLAKVKEQDGMTLAKVKEQDGMTLAKVKEQDGMTLAKVRHAQVSHAPR